MTKESSKKKAVSDADIERLMKDKTLRQRILSWKPKASQPIEEKEIKLSKIGKCTVTIHDVADPNASHQMKFTLDQSLQNKHKAGFTMIPFADGKAKIPEDLVGWFESLNQSREASNRAARYVIER